MNKKAQIQIQFHWIFILIAGAIILGFFISAALKQKDIGEQKISAAVLSDIQDILSTAISATGSLNKIDFPKIPIKITCNDGISEISVKSVSQTIPTIPLFSTKNIKSDKLFTMSRSWQIPFHAGNFLYLTSPNIRYTIIQNQLCEEITKLLPEELNIEKGIQSNGWKTSLSLMQGQNNLFEKIIFCNKDDTDINEVTAPDFKTVTKAINIKGTLLSGNITFYDVKNNQFQKQTELPYFNKASILAAIFSNDQEIYECNMKKALKRKNFVTNILINKTQSFQLTPCTFQYIQINTSLTNLNSLTNVNDLADFQSIYYNLETTNNQINQQSCPLIY